MFFYVDLATSDIFRILNGLAFIALIFVFFYFNKIFNRALKLHKLSFFYR